MSERIINAEGYYPDRSTRLILRERNIFCSDPGWAQEQKYSLIVSPQKRPHLNMPFVEKKPMMPPEEMLETWHYLKKIGLPVVPTMRKIDDTSVLMTNLTADGSFLLGKYFSSKYLFGDNDISIPDQIVKNFLKIDSREIRNKAAYYTGIASANHVELAFDDAFEVLVHQDGSWNLVMLDLTEIDINPMLRIENVEENNWEHLSIFMLLVEQLKLQVGA